MRSTAAVLIVVTVAVGVALTRVDGIAPAARWLAALTAGVIAASLVAPLGRGRRRRGPDASERDEGALETRCPLCDGTGTDPHDRARRDGPPPARCRLCGGRGWVAGG